MSTTPGDDGEVDVDAAWAKIIANWDGPTAVRPGDAEVTDGDKLADGAEIDTRDTTWDDLSAQAALDVQKLFDRDGLHFEPAEDPFADNPSPLSWDELRSDLDDLRAETQPDVQPEPAAGRSGPGSGPRDVDPDGASLIDGIDDSDERYDPPEPPPLPRPDIVTAAAWLGAVGAPILLLLAALFWRTAPPIVIGLAVVGFIAGFVTLVIRMPDHHDDDDEGAVV